MFLRITTQTLLGFLLLQKESISLTVELKDTVFEQNTQVEVAQISNAGTIIYSPEAFKFTVEGITTPIAIQMSRIDSISCFHDESNDCLVSGNMLVQLLSIPESGEPEMKTIYKLLTEARVANINSFGRVAAVSNSNYFLSAVSVNMGLMRWSKDQGSTYSRLLLDPESFKVDSFINELLPGYNSKIAYGSFFFNNMITIFDFTTMKQTKAIQTNHHGGGIAELTQDLSKSLIAISQQNYLTIMDHSNNVVMEVSLKFYIVKNMQNVRQSDFLITTEDTFLDVYLATSTIATPIIRYDNTNSIRSLVFSQKRNLIVIAGKGYVRSLEFTRAIFLNGDCHPNCEGGCNYGLSAGSCDSCITGTELVQTICTKTAESSFSISAVEFEEGEFDKVNVDSQTTLLSGNVKFILIFVGILVIIVIYCGCRWWFRQRKKAKVEALMRTKAGKPTANKVRRGAGI